MPALKVKSGPNVDYTRQELISLLPKWQLIEDCLGGSEVVKQKGVAYLPMPNASDKSTENTTRYENYKSRAVFYNVTRRTLDGMVGQVFSRDPICSIPEAMRIIKENCDGAGVTLDQQSKLALNNVMAYGRGGLLVDYPNVEKPATVQELKEGLIRPTIVLYGPKDVINWRYRTVGAVSLLDLVVIKENALASDDGFEVKSELRWRVLRLNSAGEYTVEIFKYDELKQEFVSQGTYTPKDGKGRAWREIPFKFIGVMNNDASPDQPPTYDLAVINIAHYRNSADYEDSCYMVGQPTPVFSGLTQQWVDQVLKGEIKLGSRAAVLLPVGGKAELLQVSENSMPFEAMAHKERQMVALGAKLITQQNVQRTLGEAQLEESTEASILSTATKNVSIAYTQALKWAARFYGTEQEEIEYSLNTDYPASRLSPNDRNQLILEWQAGAITFGEMRAGLRRGGVATLEDEAAKKDIKENPPPDIANAGDVQNKGVGGDKVQNKAPDNDNNGGNQSGN